MRQLLMIAYYFPPLGGAGVQRSAKFAKYLAKQGWQIRVIAAEPSSFEPRDDSLIIDIAHEAISVTRIPNREAFRGLDRLPGGWRMRSVLQDWMLFPDRMGGWFRAAYQAAADICAANPGIPVLTTSAPYTSHLIGLALKKHYQIRWIADFRDEWTQNPYLKYPTAIHSLRHKQAEHQVLTAADIVISVTDVITDGLKKLAPDSGAIFDTIPNGFDPDDFSGITVSQKSHFVITHVGTVNEERKKLLRPFLGALKKLLAEHKISGLKFHMIGPGKQGNVGLGEWEFLEVDDYLPHLAAIKAMAASNLLILAESNPAAFTGKIFEYLGLAKPILGLVHPDSPAAKLIRASLSGWVVEPDNPREMERVLTHCYHSWQIGVPAIIQDRDCVMKYNRKIQAERLASLIMR